MTNLFYYFWSAIFGLVLGSFMNVVILRDRQRKSILSDRSRCVRCKHVLAPLDLVPVLSWLVLGGRCRYCKKPISVQYPLVELAGALLSVLAVRQGYVIGGSWPVATLLLIIFLLMLAVSVIDIRTMEIPVEYCVAAAVLGLAVGAVGGHVVLSLYGLLAGAGTIACILYGWKAVTGKEGMGEGDIWVAGAVGAVVGWPYVWIALMAAVFTGAFVGIASLIRGSKGMESRLPFGPFLFLGMLVALAWGQSIVRWYIL